MSLRSLLNDLAHERDAFLEALAALPPDARTASPSADTWSPLEIGEHVFKAERSMLTGLERQLERGDARKDLGGPSRAKATALLMAMRSPQRFQAPTTVPDLALQGMPYEELRTQWTALAPRWEAAASIPEDLATVGLVRHPYAGPLTAKDALRFLVAHTARHSRQLNRTVRAAA
ncbi:MAG: DinB family protein [Rhodothermaceae bacterium]|nr:DinB family protein [Rhodothermaceae bacterium]